jgi:cell division protein FtsX
MRLPRALAMSVLERTREIGVLRALGASRWQVRSTMLDESLMITIAGAAVGIADRMLSACVASESVIAQSKAPYESSASTSDSDSVFGKRGARFGGSSLSVGSAATRRSRKQN